MYLVLRVPLQLTFIPPGTPRIQTIYFPFKHRKPISQSLSFVLLRPLWHLEPFLSHPGATLLQNDVLDRETRSRNEVYSLPLQSEQGRRHHLHRSVRHFNDSSHISAVQKKNLVLHTFRHWRHLYGNSSPFAQSPRLFLNLNSRNNWLCRSSHLRNTVSKLVNRSLHLPKYPLTLSTSSLRSFDLHGSWPHNRFDGRRSTFPY
jgi:hypothetical protein